MNQSQAMERTAPLISVGGVLKRSFTVFAQKPLVFIGLTALTTIPDLISTTTMAQSWVTQLLFVTATLTLSFMLQAAVAYGTFQVMLHREIPFGECLSHGMRRFMPLLLVSLMIITAIIAIVFGAFMLSGIAARLGNRAMPGLLPISMMFGTSFFALIFVALGLVAGAIVLGTRWLVAIPACVIEHLGPARSMRRSSLLTKGYRWQVLALFLLSTVAIFGLSFGLMLMPRQTGGFAHASSFIIALVVCIPQAFQSVTIAVIYHDLRVAKEGISVETLVSVFE